MSLYQILILFLYSLGMTLGQVLFKFAAVSVNKVDASLPPMLKVLALVANPYLFGAICVYLLLFFYWLWVLTFTLLSKAYPFVAIAFILVPIMDGIIFNETLDLRFYLGAILIAAGVALTNSSSIGL